MENEKILNLTEEEAREAVIQYRERSGRKQTDIAKELGITPSQLSQFLSGTYPAPHTTILKIEQLLKINEQREIMPTEPGFRMTKVSSAVFSLIEYSHIRRRITVAYGDAGIGKTMAVLEYKRQYPDSTIILEADPIFKTVPALYELLAAELGITETGTRKIQSKALERLRNSNTVIVIDEAQLLNTKQIEAIRIFVKKCDIGVAFVGNHAIYNKMLGSGQQQYAQVFSRIGDDSVLLNRHVGIDDIRLIFEGRGLDEESYRLLHGISQTNYGLRGAVDVYMNAVTLHGENITFSQLEAMGRKKLKK